MNPSGLESLCEEGTEPNVHVMGVFPGHNAEPVEAQYARVSKISVDSFDSSSTSSGECYENTNGYVLVTPEPGPSQSADDTFDPIRSYNNGQLHSGTTADMHNAGDEDDGPIYSPVSPDPNPSSEEDYDDIGAI